MNTPKERENREGVRPLRLTFILYASQAWSTVSSDVACSETGHSHLGSLRPKKEYRNSFRGA